MKKFTHYFLLAALSFSIVVLLLFNYYVLFEYTKGFDIDNTEWSYWKEVINPHIFKLFYVYLFFLGLGLLSLFTHFIYKQKTKVSIYIILFSIISTINIWSFEYFEIARIIIEANRSDPRGFIEPKLPSQYSIMQNYSSNNKSTQYQEPSTTSSYQQKIKEISASKKQLLFFDYSQMSDRYACGRGILIDRINQYSKERPYDYFNSGAVNQFYKCFEFPKGQFQKFPLIIKTDDVVDSIAIHMDQSNASVYLTSNKFEKHIILEEELNACGFGGVCGYWFNRDNSLLSILMYVTRSDNGCASGKPPCVNTFFTKTIQMDLLYEFYNKRRKEKDLKKNRSSSKEDLRIYFDKYVLGDLDQTYLELGFFIDSLKLWDPSERQRVIVNEKDTAFVPLAIGEYLDGKEIKIFESTFDIIAIHQKYKIELLLSSEGDGCILSDWKSFDSEWKKTEVIKDGLIYKIKPIDNTDPFLFTKEELIKATQKYCSSPKWINEIKDARSVKDPPVTIAITFFYLRFKLKNEEGNQIEKIVCFEIANGC